MTDYSKTKIYKIESHIGDKVYVGSTCKQYLSQRFQQHKKDFQRWKDGKHHRITSYELFDDYGPENCQIILIEEYPCISKDAKNYWLAKTLSLMRVHKSQKFEGLEKKKNWKKN